MATHFACGRKMLASRPRVVRKTCLVSVALLLFCFIAVHTVRLALLGWKYNAEKKKTVALSKEKEPSQKPVSSPPSPEPVYYIVERKKVRKRVKSEYSEPKPIKFE